MKSPIININEIPDLKTLVNVRFIKVSQVPDYIWSENPKSHDLGAIIQTIQNVGFDDFPRWNINLPNVGGTKGAFVYGNGRATALYHMWKDGYDVPDNVTVTEDGDWLMPVMVGNDADLTMARAYGIDHNLTMLSGADFGVKEMMASFDEPKLAVLWQQVSEDGGALTTMDLEDLQGLWRYLEEPALDIPEGAPTIETIEPEASAIESDAPASAIRQIQLFYDTETIEEFNSLVAELREANELHTLSDTILYALRIAVLE